VGSITHTAGYCAAAVAASSEMLAIGIDAESHRALDDEVMVLVVTPTERRRLAGLRHLNRVHWPTVVFSVKESVFKACSSLGNLWLDFEDVEVGLDPRACAFVARLDPHRLVQRVPAILSGRFAVDATLVRTAIALPALHANPPGRTTRP
jgi:4'-phosphopantetheinyl transferase EntD